MTKRHYFQSLVIFAATAYIVRTILELHWFEAILLIILAIVCVVHTDDMLEDIRNKKIEKLRRENGGNGDKT